MTPASTPERHSGLAHALGAYLIWGFLPLYLIYVREVPPVEFVGWRIIWTLPICLVIVVARRQLPALKEALSSWKTLAALGLSALLIGANWLIYVWAIQNGEIYAASMGYYLNPLINVLLGTVLLGERLSRLQWLAVAVAAIAVVVLLAGALSSLWISLSLGLSFGIYGLVRKQVPVGSLPGLTIESAILLLPAAAIAWWYAASAAGSSFGRDPTMSLAIVAGGALTAFPLLLFAIAARRMEYSTLGFVQFLAPSIVFILGLTVFQEPLRTAQLGSFVLIWLAIGLFVLDLVQNRAAAPAG